MTWNQSSFKGTYRKFFAMLTVCLLSSSLANATTSSAQEAFLLKRINEYWKEGDIPTTKSQIINFLKKYPESDAKEALHQVLGDLYLKEKNFSLALEQYASITNEEILKTLQYHRAICLYETQQLDTLIDHVSRILASPIPSKEAETLELFLADALMKKGLEHGDTKNQLSLFKSSLAHYKHLTKGKNAKYALMPAAELSEKLGLLADACDLYKEILEIQPENREEILYKIAMLQKSFKPKEAIKTLEQIYKLRGEKASDAAILQMQILFQEQKFKELLLVQDESLKHINQDNLSMANYWIGKSLFYLQDFILAKQHLMKAYDSLSLSPQDKKNIIKPLIICAGKNKDADLLSSLIRDWEQINPKDEEIAEAYQLQYQMLSSSDPSAAACALEKLLEKFPHHKNRETILYNLANLNFKEQKWSKASSLLRILLTDFPNGQFTIQSERQLINCTIEDVKEASIETEKIKKEHAAVQIAHILKTKKALSSTERCHLHFLRCQLLTDIQSHEEALDELQEFIDTYPKSEHLSKAFLLMAKTVCRSEDDGKLFITYAEKALNFPQNEDDAAALHSQLYNAYLLQAESASQEEKSYLLSQAANNLYCAYQNNHKIKKENLLWLANFFYEHSFLEADKKRIVTSHAEKALQIFENILDIKHYPPHLIINKNTMYKEPEIVKLADLLDALGKHDEKIDVLEALSYLQKNEIDLPWKMQRKTLLDLARAYKTSGKASESLEKYDELIQSSTFELSFLSSQAKLERSQLKYELLKTSSMEKREDMQKILDELKDLEMNKKLCSEPLHLEAALSYVEYKSSLTPQEHRNEKALHLLQLLRENFSSELDPHVTEYLSLSAKYPDKAKIYEQYMSYVDYLIVKTKADLAEQKNQAGEAKILHFQAHKAIETMNAQGILPSELLKRVRTNIEAEEKTI
jgi:outer membrane protein assembly factor BamD (BamD/ComL family)